jgi:hypothetical protein
MLSILKRWTKREERNQRKENQKTKILKWIKEQEKREDGAK